MDRYDLRLLNELQFDFPLTTRPFATLAARLGCEENEMIRREGKLKRLGVVRQISAIFASARIGYRSTLAAFEVPAGRVDTVAERLNALPGVSHNYLRENRYNLWFTLTLPSRHDLRKEIGRLARLSGVKNWLFLPTLRTFKIKFQLNMTKVNLRETLFPVDHALIPKKSGRVKRKYVQELQRDLPLVQRPYRQSAKRLKTTEKGVTNELRKYIQSGCVRRMAAVLRQKKAGFPANVMVAWAARGGEIPKLGDCAASLDLVSHCYQRPVSRQWPYSTYTMIHGRTHRQCLGVVRHIEKATGITAHVELPALKEYKKVRVEYFTPD